MINVRVDNVQLSENIKQLNNKISEFEENESSINLRILSLKDIWNDGNTISFFESMLKERNSILLLIRNLRQFCSLYNYVYSRLTRYGKKIIVDFDYVNSVNSIFNTNKQQFSAINQIFSDLNLSRCSEVASRIRSQQRKFIISSNKFNNYMLKFRNEINYLKNVEQEISSKCNAINVSLIEAIDFLNLPIISPTKSNSSANFVGMTSADEIEKNLRYLTIDFENESNLIVEIENLFENFNNNYNSDKNLFSLRDKQLDFKCSFKTMINNHENLLSYVSNLKNTYLEASNKILSEVTNIIKGV